MKPPLKRPAPALGSLIPTLNQMGYMTPTADDPYSKAFFDFAPQAPGPVLEIGAAYGVAVQEALKRGVTVFANDIDARHLEVLKNETPPDFLPRLILAPGKFPDEPDLAPETLGAILMVRVLHFFSGEQIERGIQKMFVALKSGGRVFLACESPYLNNWKPFYSLFEKRKALGEKWPGWVKTLGMETAGSQKNLPEYMHFMDPELLEKNFKNGGFKVLQTDFFSRPNFPPELRFDGRESVGIIAEKP